MHRNFSLSRKVVVALLSFITLLSISATSPSPRNTYDPALRRYPYLTDVVASYATINWATDRSEMSGLVRYGKSGQEPCTSRLSR